MLTRWIPRALSFLLLIGLWTSAPASAVDRWEQIGPEGGSIVSLVLDPSDPRILYAGTTGGVFKSTDGGGIWVPASDGLAPHRVWNLAIDPQSPQTLYAAVGDERVVKSTDGARTWQSAGAGLSGFGEGRVAIDPSVPSTLYASGSNRLFKSTDAAASWSPLDVQQQEVAALAVDPVHRTVLAGGRSGAILRSTDGGATWVQTGESQSFSPVQGFAFHPLGLAVYAATGQGLLRSADGGASWRPAGQGGLPSLNVAVVAVHPATPRILYIGLLGSLDGLASGGVFRSGDQGRTWTAVSRGLETDGIAALAIDPARPATLYAGDTGNGVFKSTDAAGRWSAVNRGLRAVDLVNVEIDPKRPRTMYAGSPYGLFKTLDGGASWRKIQDLRVIRTGLSLDPVRTFNLYLLGNGSFKSADGGETFQPLSQSGSVIAVDPRAHATVYLGSYQKVFKSTDGGRTWTAENVEDGFVFCTTVTTLFFPAGSSNELLAGGAPVCHREQGGGIWASHDAGRFWGWLSETPPYTFSLIADPADPRTLYAGGQSRLPFFPDNFKSTDGGVSWTRMPGLHGQRVQTFAFLRQPDTLHAGTESGVFETLDGGLTWSPVNEGLTSLSIRELAVAPQSSTTLYVATGGGLFRRTRNAP